MKGWLLLATAFFLWPGCSSQNEITCNSPKILNGSFRLQRTTYHDGDLIRIQCDSGFTFEPDNGEKVVECTKNGWSPSLKCVKITCNSPRILNGSFRPQRTTYHDGDLIRIQCDSGFIFEPNNGEKVVECTKNGWSPSLKCVNIGGKCGRPPPVENGDIMDSPKANYFQSESVTYQCQNLYTMEGSPRVTCQNGHWSQTPTCRGACTASEEDMREHNIKLKWANGDKIYSEDGNIVEFQCIRRHKLHPNSRSLRVNCVNGKFDYPYCIPI